MSFAEYSIVLWGGLRTVYYPSVSTDVQPEHSNLVNTTHNTGYSATYRGIPTGAAKFDYYVVDKSVIEGVSVDAVNGESSDDPYYSPSSEVYIYSSDFKTVYVARPDPALPEHNTFDAFIIIKAYTFAGWYSQTFDRTTKLWSEMACVSTDLVRPFVTTAVTDTNILALFTEVTNLEIKYNPDEVTVKFDVQTDSTGREIRVYNEYDANGNLLEVISGWFNFNSVPTALISPVGGFRIADTYTYSLNGGTTETVSYSSDKFTSFKHMTRV